MAMTGDAGSATEAAPAAEAAEAAATTETAEAGSGRGRDGRPGGRADAGRRFHDLLAGGEAAVDLGRVRADQPGGDAGGDRLAVLLEQLHRRKCPGRGDGRRRQLEHVGL